MEIEISLIPHHSNILAIFNNDATMERFAALCHNHGRMATPCASVDEAIQLLTHPNHNFNLIATTMDTAELDNFRLIRFIRDAHIAAPVYVTHNSDAVSCQAFIHRANTNDGMNNYFILKKWDQDILLDQQALANIHALYLQTHDGMWLDAVLNLNPYDLAIDPQANAEAAVPQEVNFGVQGQPELHAQGAVHQAEMNFGAQDQLDLNMGLAPPLGPEVNDAVQDQLDLNLGLAPPLGAVAQGAANQLDLNLGLGLPLGADAHAQGAAPPPAVNVAPAPPLGADAHAQGAAPPPAVNIAPAPPLGADAHAQGAAPPPAVNIAPAPPLGADAHAQGAAPPPEVNAGGANAPEDPPELDAGPLHLHHAPPHGDDGHVAKRRRLGDH